MCRAGRGVDCNMCHLLEGPRDLYQKIILNLICRNLFVHATWRLQGRKHVLGVMVKRIDVREFEENYVHHVSNSRRMIPFDKWVDDTWQGMIMPTLPLARLHTHVSCTYGLSDYTWGVWSWSFSLLSTFVQVFFVPILILTLIRIESKPREISEILELLIRKKPAQKGMRHLSK